MAHVLLQDTDTITGNQPQDNSPMQVVVVNAAGKAIPTTGGGGGAGDASAANQATQITAEQAIQATAGATTGTKVITDANGTLQQYLRGLVYLFITAGGALVKIAQFIGAANIATGQVTTSTTAATFVAARATRRSMTLKNTDAAITVYVGPATVTAGNGMPLKAGESISVDWVGLIQVIAASGTPVVAYMETYD